MRPDQVDAQLKNSSRTLFKCPENLCDYQSTSKGGVKRHFNFKHFRQQYINSIKIPFQEIRQEVYKDPASGIKITKKVKSKTENPSQTDPLKTSYVCRFCEQPASHMLELKHHLIAHLDAGEVTKEDLLRSLYGCQQCEYVASHQDNLELHTQLIHGGESNNANTSMDEDQETKEEQYNDPELGHSVFLSEQKETKQSFSNFKCALCDFRTKFEDDVREHFETQHSNQTTLDEAV